MGNSELLAVVGIILLATALLLVILRRLQAGSTYELRPLSAYKLLQEQAGRALESGRQLHLTAGRVSLASSAAPTSVAALQILGYLAAESSGSGVPPLVTVGDGTLLPAAQGALRGQYEEVISPTSYPLNDVQFVATNDFPMAYAAGVTFTLAHESLGNNVAVGGIGPELAIFAEAARRRAMTQIVGTDDPAAMAVGLAYTDNVLWGEELLTAAAYLEGSPVQLAGVQTQDMLRLLIAAVILLVALLRAVGLF